MRCLTRPTCNDLAPPCSHKLSKKPCELWQETVLAGSGNRNECQGTYPGWGCSLGAGLHLCANVFNCDWDDEGDFCFQDDQFASNLAPESCTELAPP